MILIEWVEVGMPLGRVTLLTVVLPVCPNFMLNKNTLQYNANGQHFAAALVFAGMTCKRQERPRARKTLFICSSAYTMSC
jgi:hypothetical protein